MNSPKYGLLLNDNIKLHRGYFAEMCKMLGITVKYRAPLPDKHYTTYAEIESSYAPPIDLGCIFTEHPDQRTLRKMGWVSELQESSSIIHIPYDTPGIQQGALFYIPSGLDNGAYRLFRCVKLTNSIVYPASISCEIVPEFEDIYNKSDDMYQHSSLNVLSDEEEDYR